MPLTLDMAGSAGAGVSIFCPFWTKNCVISSSVNLVTTLISCQPVCSQSRVVVSYVKGWVVSIVLPWP